MTEFLDFLGQTNLGRVAVVWFMSVIMIYWLYLVWWVGRPKFKRRHGRPKK